MFQWRFFEVIYLEIYLLNLLLSNYKNKFYLHKKDQFYLTNQCKPYN